MTGGCGVANYTWSGPGILSTTSIGSVSSFSVVPTTSGAYTLALTYSGIGCNSVTAVSATVTPTPQSWIGTSNSDWNTASNWLCGTVPLATDAVIINGATPVSYTHLTLPTILRV